MRSNRSPPHKNSRIKLSRKAAIPRNSRESFHPRKFPAFQLEWPTAALHYHISFKELFAGLVACSIWAKRWRGCRVQLWCDNQAAVHAVNSRSCRDPAMMRLVRCLFFLEAWFDFELVAAHLPGRDNMLADDLSRNRLSNFLSKAQSPDPVPSTLPPGLPELLLDHSGWTSPHWTRRFFAIATGCDQDWAWGRGGA